MAGSKHFTPRTFGFLRALAKNNEREWFKQEKERYERDVREPALAFVTDFAPHLARISPHFRADPRPSGGSLFRIHRDTRFSKDKRPYKTHTGVQFRHDRGKDVHCPGFYLHLEPGNCFAAAGIWRPDGPALRAVREEIVEAPAGWKKASRGKRFTETFTLEGDRLSRPPKGFDPEHPLIEDLKWKDFIAVHPLTQGTVTGDGFLADYTRLCTAAVPLMKFLCGALEVPF